MTNNIGLYVHIPFCVQKCRYCDFLSFPCGEEVRDAYVDALCRELGERAQEDGARADTVFIGGGTPSLLEPEQIRTLGAAIQASYDPLPGAEYSVEVNPGTLTEEKLRAFRDIGVNRVSMGVQSLDEGMLKTIGRIHTAEQARTSMELLRRCGFDNVNLDLMFSLPGQTLSQWEETLREALAMEPEHLSFYALTIEEGTPFFDAWRAGTLPETPEELDRSMYALALDMLKDQGYHHYEISNAARPGLESRHNLKYWTMQDYIGVGLGAHSFRRGVRSADREDLEGYLRGGNWQTWQHRNTEKDTREETVFTGLRLVDGLSKDLFRQQTGQDLEEAYPRELEKMICQGLLEDTCDRVRLTRRGLDLANTVMREFIQVE